MLVSLDAKTKEPDQMPLGKASQGLRDKGIKVYSVGIKPHVEQQDLEDTTATPSNVYIIAADQLANTGRRIADTLSGYVKDPSRESGQCIFLIVILVIFVGIVPSIVQNITNFTSMTIVFFKIGAGEAKLSLPVSVMKQSISQV